MAQEQKRATVYLDARLHKLLKLKALETSMSLSQLVNDAVRHELTEDEQDLAAFRARVNEPAVTYEAMLRELKRDGKI